jgi:hypothetical protein
MARKTVNPKLQAADGIWERPPHLEGSFPDADPGAVPTEIWVFVTSITNEFILGLDILCAYDASVKLGHQTLHLAEEEVLLWSPRVGPWPSSLVVASDQVITAQYEEVVLA